MSREVVRQWEENKFINFKIRRHMSREVVRQWEENKFIISISGDKCQEKEVRQWEKKINLQTTKSGGKCH